LGRYRGTPDCRSRFSLRSPAASMREVRSAPRHNRHKKLEVRPLDDSKRGLYVSATVASPTSGRQWSYHKRRVRVTPSHQASTPAPLDTFRLGRRDLLPLVGAAAVAALFAPTVASAAGAPGRDEDDDGQSAPSRYVYVGTYTAPNTAPGGIQPSTARGIYVFKMDGGTGGLTEIQVVEIENPSWVAVDANATHLYATSEVSTWKGASNTGGITAFGIDPGTGNITSMDDQPTGGAIPAHVIVDPSGKFALVANYVGANWSVLPILDNGGLGSPSGVFAVTGHGPNTARQEAPHPHHTV